MQVDLNADMGESFGPWKMGDDASLLKTVTSANIACGAHAGDPDVMAQTMQIALENGSDYAAPGQEQDELDFINHVLQDADCLLLLDVNNIIVNSVNHRYDPFLFLEGLDLSRTAYIHVAGHYHEAPDLRVDTHGAAVEPEVWSLLARAYELLGPVPTLLERDFNFPPLDELLAEVDEIRSLQASAPNLGAKQTA